MKRSKTVRDKLVGTVVSKRALALLGPALLETVCKRRRPFPLTVHTFRGGPDRNYPLMPYGLDERIIAVQ